MNNNGFRVRFGVRRRHQGPKGRVISVPISVRRGARQDHSPGGGSLFRILGKKSVCYVF